MYSVNENFSQEKESHSREQKKNQMEIPEMTNKNIEGNTEEILFDPL